MDAIYSRPWSRHNNTRGRRDARLKNMCIKVRISDDFKGKFVCFFFLWCFMNFGKETWYLFPFFPGNYFAFVILVVVVFFSFLFFIFSFGRPELRIIYIFFFSNDIISIQNVHSYQTTWIESIHTLSDQSCPIQNVPHHRFRAFRILSDHAAFTRSCRVAWNAAVKPSLSWGSFTTASPRLKWRISERGRTSMKERVKSWGKGDEKHGKP